MNQTIFMVMALAPSIALAVPGAEAKPFHVRHPNGASSRWDGNTLTVDTGEISRSWKWTGAGFATTALKDIPSGCEWVADNDSDCDWDYPGLIRGKAELVGIRCGISDDEGFTSEHLNTTAEIHYPESKVALKFQVRVYPGSPGLRVQLQLKALPGFDSARLPDKAGLPAGRVESLPVKTAGLTRRAIGYYNDTQHRNQADMPILREEPTEAPEISWASVLQVTRGQHGLMMVKESHKCVNQAGWDTGSFIVSPGSLASTGWGIAPGDLVEDRYRGLWANWTVLYEGDDIDGQLALKRFDRSRYPVDPARDIYIMANTWGSGRKQIAAQEENVLAEIASQADLGIDVQQIDDGWQGRGYGQWRPQARGRPKNGESYDIYPDGWSNVVAAAKKHGVKLGLWAAWWIPVKDLIWNQKAGGFRYFKIDFAKLVDLDALEGLILGKARRMILASGHRARVNWDVTENKPRVGYFFAREYGNIYLENRKPASPKQAIYIPWLVLRDAWQVSKYLNLNKFQVTVQNGARCDARHTDAGKHRPDYLTAQALMASPIFFQETHFYSPEAREKIRPLLALYKKHRRAMFDGYVFPVGHEPDNKHWSGFQNHNPDAHSGYFMICRPIESEQDSSEIKVHFLRGRNIRLTDLLAGTSETVRVPDDGSLSFHLESPGSFSFCQYTILPDGK